MRCREAKASGLRKRRSASLGIPVSASGNVWGDLDIPSNFFVCFVIGVFGIRYSGKCAGQW